MLALVFGHPLDFLCMAGAAFRLGVIRQLQRSDGHMGVGMTAHAILKLEMRSVRIIMAAGTFRDEVLAIGKVFHMAIKTGDFRLMFSSVAGDPLRLLGVTFGAVRHLQMGLLVLSCCRPDRQKGK